ncbi:MAG: GAF domain-containing sensor histidine kinase [Candidatus Schekmanbacteria bacterium]|nr:GAF domain-containing sensor histidine kinase [Candidatus Schekmanbacteria bacterium]
MTLPLPDNPADVAPEIALRDRQLDAVRRLAADLCAVTDLEETIRQALQLSLHVVNATAGSILLLDTAKNELVFKYVVGPGAEKLRGLALPAERGVCGAVLHSGQVRVSEDMTEESEHLGEIGNQLAQETRNMVTVPLQAYRGKRIGVMQVLNKVTGRFDRNDISTLAILGTQVGAAIEAARLHEEARVAQAFKVIGDISHDVKNMITPVLTGAEALLMINEDAFRRHDAALAGARCTEVDRQAIAESTRELRELLPEMVELLIEVAETVQQRVGDISAAVKGVVSKPYFEPSDICDLVRKVAAFLRPQSERARTAMLVTVHGEVPLLELDRKQIFNALYNVLANGLEACEAGGTVAVDVSALPDGEFPDGGYCMISCRDSGPGMPDHVRQRLFTDDIISTKPRGTGLGTRIVRNVVEAHGGKVWVERVDAEGTTIAVKLPLSAACRNGNGASTAQQPGEATPDRQSGGAEAMTPLSAPPAGGGGR